VSAESNEREPIVQSSAEDSATMSDVSAQEAITAADTPDQAAEEPTGESTEAAEKPAEPAIEEPTATEEAAEEATATEDLVAAEEATATEDPVATEKPAATEQPVKADKPDKSKAKKDKGERPKKDKAKKDKAKKAEELGEATATTEAAAGADEPPAVTAAAPGPGPAVEHPTGGEPGATTQDASLPSAPEAPAGPAAPAKLGPIPLPRSTKGRILSAAALVAVLGAGAAGYAWYHATHVPDGVAFRVYGQNVTVAQLNEDVQTDKALFGLQPPAAGPKLDQFRKDFAKAEAVTMIIDHAAAERNIVVAQRQVSDVLARFITQTYGEGQEGHDKFVQDLANEGTSEQKVLNELRRQMTLTRLTQQIAGDIKVTDQDVKQAFDRRRAKLGTPELREIHNIVVQDRAAADDIVNQLGTGTNFEQLAQQRSLDGSTKDQGGNLGQVSAEQLEPGYADVAFKAPVGSVFGPVQTQYGWNVGKVISSQPPTPADFDKVKDALRQQLFTERALDKWNKFLSQEIKDAGVVYAPEYRPADPDAPPSVPTGSAADEPPAPEQVGAVQPAPGQPEPVSAPPR
jgi:peptidyl-prolyl cis-trans isomerase C